MPTDAPATDSSATDSPAADRSAGGASATQVVVPPVPTDAPVLVTGATGYVAGVLIERLLREGLTVHATVRDASKTDRLRTLSALADDRPGRIQFFSANLLEEGSFAEAMAGCRVVFHVASPFTSSIEDPQRDLVDPAVGGTANVLSQANAIESVERVVVTSSCAAIYGDSIDLDATPRGVFDEDVWNTSSSLTHNAYSYSKTQAEKKAWEIADAQDRWRLVVCNPALVMGPGVKVHTSSESFSIMKRLIDGEMAAGVPDLRIGVVDVRDVAEAHFRAGFLPDAQGRHVLVGTNATMPMMAEALKPRWAGKLKLPKRVLPKWLVWLAAPAAGLTRDFVSKNIGLAWQADASKSREQLGLHYRPLEETLDDFTTQIVDGGYVEVAGQAKKAA